ncbi:MAG: peptidase U32 [Deltaproteobacteria bacterium SG8_13]|nr:MAG: peptidase U32 [Deltaproteobacteria bacterium SG8_13]
MTENPYKPEILAPAGSRDAFLAALAAGADAVYCGLKSYSARMEAKNFSLAELASLTRLAHQRKAKVYVTFNSLLQPGDLEPAGQLIDQLQRNVHPDALIVQDLAVVALARQVGFSGKIHLSTLTNVSFAAAMGTIGNLKGVSRVVLPRELSVDEIKAIAASCPPDFGLETFVHGALCYAVSGRCYWSSFLGGKSGLRGRCVQPCRRVYSQGEQSGRFFSCQDLSVDVLVKVLLTVPQIKAWKIEGRKKGPHYVYYTVKAYQMLRDLSEVADNRGAVKKSALDLLSQSLGRTGTHYNLLPQRPQKPVDVSIRTGSGMFVGTIQGPRQGRYVVPRIELLSGDSLRIGTEDEDWHLVQKVGKFVPKKGRFHITAASRRVPDKGTPVFLTDRREQALAEMIDELASQLPDVTEMPVKSSTFAVKPMPRARLRPKRVVLTVYRSWKSGSRGQGSGLWISPAAVDQVPAKMISQLCWWLPPVVWPADEAAFRNLLARVQKKGGLQFVLNAPWQTALFDKKKKPTLWAGPFCNLANPLALEVMADAGFAGAIVSPELGKQELLNLPQQSPLPLGVVIGGSWPLCISRTIADGIAEGRPFASPRGEQAWYKKYGPDYWTFPNWKLDLTAEKETLIQTGYQMLVHLAEPVPRAVKMKRRPGLWNWRIGLK